MTNQFAIIIPVFNHGTFIHRTVNALLPFGLPVYITDDGSDEETEVILQDLAEKHPLIHLSRFDVNCGKGAAVMEAMDRAWENGCTHVLQIDADGQHDPNDVPRFLTMADKYPEAVVAGQPVFDQSVPKARLYGRYITHFWVWIETLSFSIKDAMCGFRLYPLKATIPLIRKVRIPPRMDFDIAIIVRLLWNGVPVTNVPTRVTYPEDGISHFHTLKDNVRISRTHTLLVIGMILRLPVLLGRKIKRCFVKENHWARMAERGTLLGLKTVSWTYRLLGRRIALILMWPVTAYFFVTGRTARKASLKYLREVYKTFGSHEDLPREPNAGDSFRHFYTFTKSGLDKFGAWFGRENGIKVVFPDREALLDIQSAGRGAVFIGAHLGNMEMSRAKAVVSGLSGINAVVFTDHAVRFTELLKSVNPKFDLNLIQVSSLGPETSILLQEKIDRGEMLFIMGDRTPPREGGRIITVPFLGNMAPFPQGPYILSHLLACPVYLFFCIKEGNIYRIHLELFAERIRLPRKGREEQIQAYAANYAKRLEYYCGRSPLQWFNFFDFWRAGPSPTD